MIEKITLFINLVNCYQEKVDCIKTRFNNFEEEFNSIQNDVLALEKAESLSKDFALFYKDFFNYYAIFFNEYHNEPCTNKEEIKEYVDYAKVYLESCGLNILKLNTNYIQPLTNKITIEKANNSIFWGKWSVGLGWGSILIGLAATIISLCFSIDSDKSIKGLTQELFKQEAILNDNKKILNTLDSLLKINNFNLLNLTEKVSEGSNSENVTKGSK